MLCSRAVQETVQIRWEKRPTRISQNVAQSLPENFNVDFNICYNKLEILINTYLLKQNQVKIIAKRRCYGIIVTPFSSVHANLLILTSHRSPIPKKTGFHCSLNPYISNLLQQVTAEISPFSSIFCPKILDHDVVIVRHFEFEKNA